VEQDGQGQQLLQPP